MRLKDIHTNLSEEVNLLEKFPKKEISVDSFSDDKKIIVDISDKKEYKTIKIWKAKKIKINKINIKNNFDVLKKSTFINNDIILNDEIKNQYKSYFLKKIRALKLFYIKNNNNNFSTNNFNLLYVARKFFSYFNILIKLFKPLYIFIFLFIILLFIDKLAVEYYTNSGYKKIVQLKNTENREELIKSANFDFVISNILFKPFSLFKTEKIKNADNLIFWGLKITNLLKNLNKFEKWVNKLISEKWSWNIMFSQLLLNNKDLFKYTEKEITEIKNIFDNIDFSENENLQAKVDIFKVKINEVIFYNNVINNNFDNFLEILWHNKRKKYLIVFQNNDEIRPQWGFMWSLWILEIFRWQIKKFEKKDIYDYEFKIKKENFERELAPKWLDKLTTYLWLRDSNYFINHKDSGDKIKFFIEKSGYDIDWIIYVNQNSLFKILDLVWEFDSKTLNTKINSKNFSLVMSSLVESKKSKVWTLWTPKQVLFDFMEEFKELLKTRKINNFHLAKILLEDVKNREISFYNFNETERVLLEQLWLFNPIKYNESLDFNYPVFTSISWNKSDRYIKTSYKKEVIKWEKCSYITNLEIKLEHTFDKKEETNILNIFDDFWIKKDSSKLLYIQWKWENRQYVRVIVPKNAIIKKKSNIWITPYYKRWKSIDFFLNTKKWEKSTFKIEYILPNNECKNYNYKLYKQPWIRKYNFEIEQFWKNKIFKENKKDIYIN